MKKEIVFGLAGALSLYLLLRGQGEWLAALAVIALALVLLDRISLERLVPGETPYPPPVTFSDIGGQETAKEELKEALDFLHYPEKAQGIGVRPLKGILLAGPPGTGKTMLARAAANYISSPFLSASGSEFIELYAGVGARRIRQLFQRARRLARSSPTRAAVVFIDELEILGGRRGRTSSHLEYDQTLNQLLVEMDGLNGGRGETVLVIGATNRPDLLDEALLRPGRFDRVIRVWLPDRKERMEILKVHLRSRKCDPDLDLERLAQETFGFSGAHLESLVNEAAILAVREGSPLIRQRHLLEAVDKVSLGERERRNLKEEEKRRLAAHEAGHALAGELLRPGSVARATIAPRGPTLGFVRSLSDGEGILSRETLEEEIAIALAGPLSEELICGSPSTGGTSDMSRASDLAFRLVQGGMSSLGPVLEGITPAGMIHEEVSRILKGQKERLQHLFALHRPSLLLLAQRLYQKETLSGEEIRELLSEPQLSLALPL